MTSVLKSKREAEEQVTVMPREEVSLWPAVAVYADGKVREAEARKQGNGFSLKNSTKDYGPADTWILAQWEPCQTSNLQNCNIINCVVLSL